MSPADLFWWICSDLVVVRLRSCVFGLDPFDLRYSLSVAVAVLGGWFYGALAQQLSDCLLQQVMPDSGDGRAMTAARLQLASVFVVVVRWSTDLDVTFICVHYTAILKMNRWQVFLKKKCILA